MKDPNGHIIRCDLEKADLLNTFFASVFVRKPPGKLPVFDVRYQVTQVTSLKTDTEVLTKQLKNMNTSNYRPVILTCLPSRLCEKTVRDKIMKHMNDNNLFSTCQYGFRNKRSSVYNCVYNC